MTTEGETTRLEIPLTEITTTGDFSNETVKKLFFEVQSEYGFGLCTDLADAYVVGILNYCMRLGINISSDLPISKQLSYQLREFLIPVLAKEDSRLKVIKIIAETKDDKDIRSGNNVGTGISCGVDSLHAIQHYLDYDDKSYRLTHLHITDVGAFNGIYGDRKHINYVKDRAYERARKVSKELGLPLVETKSNFQEVIPQNHYLTNSYSAVFSIMMMRYFWGKYYLASAGTNDSCVLKDNSTTDSAHYDLFMLPLVSTETIKIYSEGLGNRYEKIKDLSDYWLAQKYLYSCTAKEYNCGKCPKCLRNLWILDSLGKLKSFSEAYNVEEYYSNRRKLMYKMLNASKIEQFYLTECKQHFLKNKDPDYLYCLKAFSEISQIIHEYQNKNYCNIGNLEQYVEISPNAALYLGKAFHYGLGTRKNYEKSATLLFSSHRRGNVDALIELGRLFLDGYKNDQMLKDVEIGLRYWVSKNGMRCEFILGMLINKHLVSDPNDDTGLKYIKKSATHGYNEAKDWIVLNCV